jgi:apolipoprotein N-acyltransferase
MKLNDTTAVAILCTLSSGVLYAASRDITPFGPLVLIAPIPILLYALSAVRAWRAFATAFVARGIGATAFIYAYMDALPPSVLALATIAASAEFAIVVVLSRIAVQRLPTWAATLSFPVLATATEFLLQLPSPHGTFGALGHALIDVLPLVQVASLGGVAAVSFVAALIPMSIVLLTHAPTHWRSVLIVGATPVFLATVYGFWRLSMPYEDRTRVALASIDALTLRAIEDPTKADAVAGAYAELLQAFEGQQVEAVVLPERVFVDVPESAASASALLQSAANRLDARIVAGFDEVLDEGRHANTARVFSPQSPRLTYVKRRLIPGLEAGLAPGSESLLIGDRGVAICKDLDFAPMIREYGERGAALMFVPAWDFTLDGRMHARMAVMRGIENGFGLARAAATGRLTVSDAFGRIASEAITSSDGATMLVADVGLVSKRTIYSRIGDVFAWLIVAGAGVLLIAMMRTSRGGVASH